MIKVIIQLVVFLSYLTYILSVYEKLPSISHSYYRFEKGEKSLFTIVLYIIGILQCSHVGLHPLLFLSGAGLCFIGAANSFQDEKMTYRVHVGGTIVGILSAIIALILIGSWIFLIPSLILSIYSYLNKSKTLIWDIEFYSFLGIAVCLMYKYGN